MKSNKQFDFILWIFIVLIEWHKSFTFVNWLIKVGICIIYLIVFIKGFKKIIKGKNYYICYIFYFISVVIRLIYSMMLELTEYNNIHMVGLSRDFHLLGGVFILAFLIGLCFRVLAIRKSKTGDG